MSIENLEARLAQMAGAWEDAPTDTGSLFTPPPDGDYQALVHEFRFVEGGTPVQAFLVNAFQIDNDPEYSGRIVDTMFSLEDPERIKWLKAHFAKLGVDVEHVPITQIVPGSPLLNGLLDTPVLIRVKRSDKLDQRTGLPRVNIYLQERLGSPGAAAPVSDLQTGFESEDFAPVPVGRNAIQDDDDIPF